MVYFQVDAPLQRAKQVSMLSVQHFKTVFSVTKHVSEQLLNFVFLQIQSQAILIDESEQGHKTGS